MPSVKRLFDHPAITTDVIVGFRGNGRKNLLSQKSIWNGSISKEMHIFKYSRREGTKAAVMKDQIPESVKAERSDVLLSLETKMSEEYRKHYGDSVLSVLFDRDSHRRKGIPDRLYASVCEGCPACNGQGNLPAAWQEIFSYGGRFCNR